MSRVDQIEATTESLLLPIIEKFEYELVDVEFVKEAGTHYLRVYIDKPGGITIDDCENVSRAFSEVLDEKDYIEEAYIFEVSSPGLGRALKKEKDLIRHQGQEVELKLYKAINKQKEFSGILEAFDASTITLQYENNTTQVFERSDIALIRLAINF